MAPFYILLGSKKDRNLNKNETVHFQKLSITVPISFIDDFEPKNPEALENMEFSKR